MDSHIDLLDGLNDAIGAVGDPEGEQFDARKQKQREDVKTKPAPNETAKGLREMKTKLGTFAEQAIGNNTTVLAALLHPQLRVDAFEKVPGVAERCRKGMQNVSEIITNLELKATAATQPEQLGPTGTEVISPLSEARRNQ
ncbi:unnamed protein product [Tilletia laevis]|uniref:Uncharacterized protein n=1 Tax=Tilletia laevis TaxID=157183 RepID=A0A9N8LNL4_9BASI|nr:unnamed protein product [Tilletia laevis]CAD7062817.1 unnamed protein product [Tilletia caries]